MRSPVVAGQFYASDFLELNKQIEECFREGPGALPVKRTAQKIKAIIVPHAGYVFSGKCAAWAYKEIAESHFPKTYVLLGFSHHGMRSGISIEDWKTPFGLVKTNKDLARELKDIVPINEEPHTHEHSIEVQLPFLQFANKDRMKEIRILAISIGRDLDYKKVGTGLASALAGKDVVIIVSSDFTHYGPSYGYVPFTTDIPERLNKLDKQAIDLITALDVDGFAKFINETNITICGYYPILTLMKMLNQAEGSLLMHYTSGDITKDYRNSVSYASILFK